MIAYVVDICNMVVNLQYMMKILKEGQIVSIIHHFKLNAFIVQYEFR
jgi:hypothetical protein